MSETNSEFLRCPCCLAEYSSIDDIDYYERVSSWDALKEAARTLGKRNKGIKRTITPETRAARIATLARWRAGRAMPKGAEL